MGVLLLEMDEMREVRRLVKRGDKEGLVRLLGGEEPKIRANAVAALGELGDASAVAAVALSVIGDPDASVRLGAVRALANLDADFPFVSGPNPEVTHPLLEALRKDSDSAVRVASANALRRRAFEPDVLDALSVALDDDDLVDSGLAARSVAHAAAVSLGWLDERVGREAAEAAGQAVAGAVRRGRVLHLHACHGRAWLDALLELDAFSKETRTFLDEHLSPEDEIQDVLIMDSTADMVVRLRDRWLAIMAFNEPRVLEPPLSIGIEGHKIRVAGANGFFLYRFRLDIANEIQEYLRSRPAGRE